MRGWKICPWGHRITPTGPYEAKVYFRWIYAPNRGYQRYRKADFSSVTPVSDARTLLCRRKDSYHAEGCSTPQVFRSNLSSKTHSSATLLDRRWKTLETRSEQYGAYLWESCRGQEYRGEQNEIISAKWFRPSVGRHPRQSDLGTRPVHHVT
jgi:hypothetical protein